MKIKCINNTKEIGWIQRSVVPIDGLTLNKVYEVTPISVVNHYFEGTQIDFDDYKFLLYDDNHKWVTHDLKLFKPVDKEAT